MRKSAIVKKLTSLLAGKCAVATAFCVVCTATAFATPVEVDWKAGETMPAKVARPFSGFLSDGRFLVAGGSYFENGKKVYSADIHVRELDGTWKKVGELPHPVAEGVCCETPNGIFCAGGTDGEKTFDEAYKLLPNGDTFPLLHLPEPITMGAAAYDNERYFVIDSKNVYCIDLLRGAYKYDKIGEIPGPARKQMVAAIQNGDQKEKMLVIYGGYDADTKHPLHDGYALVLSSITLPRQEMVKGKDGDLDLVVHPAGNPIWKKLSSLKTS